MPPDLHPDFDDALLKRDPLLFFNLSSGWTETDLKRAYTGLIRRWKPDRFPEEFKRLRAAYDALRASGPSPLPASAPATPETAPGREKENFSSETIFENPAPPPVDTRPASEIFLSETAGEAERILTSRENSPVDILTLAYLRAGETESWPELCLKTVLEGFARAKPESDTGCLVAAVERVIASAPKEDFRRALDAFAPFEEHGIYFDITTGLWIAFSKSDPDSCLMRLDRLMHFSPAGRGPRHPFFLLRFCIAGAFRLPADWLREQTRHLGSLRGLPEAVTPASGRLASHSPFGTGARNAGDELDFLESLLRVREDLEKKSAAGETLAESYRTLISAYLEKDPETCLREWSFLSRKTSDLFFPWTETAGPAYRVLGRIKAELASVITAPDAPVEPVGIWHAQFSYLCLLAAGAVLVVAALVSFVFGIGIHPAGVVVVPGLWCAVMVLDHKKSHLIPRFCRLLMRPVFYAVRRGLCSPEYAWQRLAFQTEILRNMLRIDEGLKFRLVVFFATR